jgi:hypothetical protein
LSRRAAAVFALALLVGVCATPLAGAQQPGGPLFGLRPSLYGKTTLEKGHFQYAVKAGSKVQDAVEVLNLTDESLKVQLYPADLEQSPGGAVSPAQATDEMEAVGEWMGLERDSVTLPPKGKKYVSFTVDVPKDVRPGDYLGAVVGAVNTEQMINGLTVESRVALTARVRVPGSPKLAAEIGPLRVTDGGRTFDVELRNTGNLFFTTKGTVDIDSGGRRVASLRLSPPDVYLIPGGRASFRARWDDPPLFGGRTAVASFDTNTPDEGFRRLSSDAAQISFFSTTFVMVVIGLIGGIAVLLVVLRRRTATPPPAADHSLAPSGRR